MTHIKIATIKIILSGLITTASLNIKADTLNGFLDLSNLYGNTNAGRYSVTLNLNTRPTAALEITQKLSAPPSEDQPGSEPQVCLTEFKVNAGELSLVMTDTDKNQHRHHHEAFQNISLYSSHFDETEKCSPVSELLKLPLNFTPYFSLGFFKLNYPAPFAYTELLTSISVFPYGYNVVLNISKDTDTTYFVDNLKTQLSLQLRRSNKEALSYSVYAQRGSSSLSLGQGFIELK